MWLDSAFRGGMCSSFFCFWPGNEEFAHEGIPVLVRVGMPLCPGCACVCRIQAAGGQAHRSVLPCQPPAKVEAESKYSLILMAKAISAATFFPLIVSALSFLLLVKLLWLIRTPLFPLYFGCTMRHGWSYFPHQGLNPGSLWWKCSVLTNGPPGTSLPQLFCFVIYDLASNYIYN